MMEEAARISGRSLEDVAESVCAHVEAAIADGRGLGCLRGSTVEECTFIEYVRVCIRVLLITLCVCFVHFVTYNLPTPTVYCLYCKTTATLLREPARRTNPPMELQI